MKIKSLLFTAALPLALAACGNAKDAEAKRLGFSSADEMEDVQSKGWHTHAQYNADETERAHRGGFTDVDELHRADQAGVKDKAAYDKYVADLDAQNEQFSKEEDAKKGQEPANPPSPEAQSGSSGGFFSSIFGSSGSSSSQGGGAPKNPGLATRALNPGTSTGADFEKWKEAGANNYDETWIRYPISEVNTDYTGHILTYLHLKLHLTPDQSKGQVLPSFNNIKADLAKWCGGNWSNVGSSNDGRVAEKGPWSCEVDMPTDGSGPVVLIMKKGS